MGTPRNAVSFFLVHMKFQLLLDDYCRNLEQKWQLTLPQFTDQELLKFFPEAVSDFPEIIRELREECADLIRHIKHEMQLCRGEDDLAVMFIEECVKLVLVIPLVQKERTISFLQGLIAKKNPESTSPRFGVYTESQIQNARAVSIVEVAERHMGSLRVSGKTHVGRCPFHEDKTPSFYLYQDSNMYHCFGCNAHGDVISFVQKILNLDFPQAINYLIHQ